jgi:hypothetical protein
LGIEIDFQHVSDMFRKGDSIFDLDSFTTVAGSNSLQSLTVVAHYGWPLGTEGRFPALRRWRWRDQLHQPGT